MISYEKARAAFEEYLNGYDHEADKIRLKIVHTYGVVDCMKEITGKMDNCRVKLTETPLYQTG